MSTVFRNDGGVLRGFAYEPGFSKYAQQWKETGKADMNGWAYAGGSRGTPEFGYVKQLSNFESRQQASSVPDVPRDSDGEGSFWVGSPCPDADSWGREDSASEDSGDSSDSD